MTSKQRLRAQARVRRAQLAAAHPRFAEAIAGLSAAMRIPPGSPVAGYWPIRDEADPRALMEFLARAGHIVALPCLSGRSAPLRFRRWHTADAIVLNAHGVREPLESAPEITPGAVLVPLLAFDADGYRLGYGGGCYDRTLATLRASGPLLAIGIAFAGQETDALPRESHDHRLDMVVSEAGVRRFKS